MCLVYCHSPFSLFFSLSSFLFSLLWYITRSVFLQVPRNTSSDHGHCRQCRLLRRRRRLLLLQLTDMLRAPLRLLRRRRRRRGEGLPRGCGAYRKPHPGAWRVNVCCVLARPSRLHAASRLLAFQPCCQPTPPACGMLASVSLHRTSANLLICAPRPTHMQHAWTD